MVSVVLDNLAAGVSHDEIIASYPGLTDADLDAALAYAAELAREGTVPLPLEIGAWRSRSTKIFRHGFDAETVREENLAGADDDIIAATIERENRVLITLDLDFSDIRTYSPQRYSGIVVLRPKAQDKIAIMARLRRLLKALETTARTRRSGLSSPIEFGIADDARSVIVRRNTMEPHCD
jgi:predicted nuclease of predicted toxin-antitoxin system